MTNNSNVYAVHMRVSTEMQAEEGESLEMQEQLAMELIQREGGSLYKIYPEPALSASKTRMSNRPELLKLLADAKDNKFTHLIAYRRDRLFRNAEESIVVRNILKSEGIQVIFTARGEAPMDFDDIYAPVMENLRATLDEVESVQTSIRVSDTMANKAKKGEWTGGVPPYGYKNINGFLKPIESQMPYIKEIEDMYIDGYGIHSIMKWLEGHEVRGKGRRASRAIKLVTTKTGTPKWTIDNINTILFNSTYSGYMSYSPKGDKKGVKDSKELISIKSDFIEPIRSEERQYQLDSIRRKKRESKQAPRKFNTSFLLTGIVKCEHCGETLFTSTTQKKGGKPYSYYRCRSQQNRTVGECDNKVFYNKDILEEIVILSMKKHIDNLLNDDIAKRIKEAYTEKKESYTEELSNIERTIQQSNKELNSLKRLIFDLDDSDEMYEELRDMYQEDQREALKKLSKAKKEKDKIEELIFIQKNNEITTEEIKERFLMFSEVMDSASIMMKKQLMENMFKVMTVDKEGNVNLELDFNKEKKGGEQENSVMFLRGDGTPTQPNNIKELASYKANSINYFDALQNIEVFLKNNLHRFLRSKSEDIFNFKHFHKITGLSRHFYRKHIENKNIPVDTILNIILKSVNSNIDELSYYLSLNGVMCSSKLLRLSLLSKRNNISGRRSRNL